MIRLPRKRSGAIQTPAFADIARHDWSILSPTQPQGDDWTTTGTPTLMGTPHGLGWRFGSGNYFNAVDVIPFSAGVGNDPDWLIAVTFVVTSNATTDAIFSLGSSATDAGPIYVLQNNAGVLRQVRGSFFDLEPSIIGRLYTAVVTYSDVAPYPFRLYINGALSYQNNGYINTSDKNFYVGSGFPGQTANAVILQAAMAVGRGANYVNARGLSEDHRLILPHKTRGVWVPVSAGGGGTTISATPGNAAADGTTASVKRTIPATPGNASASGTTASVIRVIGAAPGNAVADGTTAAVTRSIAATPGNAVADGVTATVTNSGTTTISCTPGNAAADGALAAITRTIAAAPGNAVANGAIAALLRVIATTPGNAVADGVTAAIQGSITISCTPGNAVADGVAATVTAAVSQLDLILKILRNRQELNPATGKFTLYDDDGTTILKQSNAWADVAGTRPYSGGTLARIDALI